MREYIKYKIWDEMGPTRPYSRWVLEKMFRLHPLTIDQICRPHVTNTAMTEWVYHFQAKLGLVSDERPDAKYLNPWNAARSDLIAELIPLPYEWTHEPEPYEEQFTRVQLQLQPHGDTSLWLTTYLFGFDREEIKVLMPNMSIISWDNMGTLLVPLLVSCFRRMNEVRLTGETLSRYHKTRHLLLKYYLDAKYHAINF